MYRYGSWFKIREMFFCAIPPPRTCGSPSHRPTGRSATPWYLFYAIFLIPFFQCTCFFFSMFLFCSVLQCFVVPECLYIHFDTTNTVWRIPIQNLYLCIWICVFVYLCISSCQTVYFDTTDAVWLIRSICFAYYSLTQILLTPKYFHIPHKMEWLHRSKHRKQHLLKKLKSRANESLFLRSLRCFHRSPRPEWDSCARELPFRRKHIDVGTATFHITNTNFKDMYKYMFINTNTILASRYEHKLHWPWHSSQLL